ncbi:MAG: prolipoprotein diacylglyceryl transferase [Clostridia bacterium]
MNYNIRFDGLGINLNINSVAFSIGNFQIYWYAICITVGFLLALVYALLNRKRFNLTEDNILDSILLGVPLAIICARLYYVLFDLGSFHSFWDVIDLRNGGIAIYGGIIGAGIAGIILYKFRKIDILSLFDVGALGFLIGQAVGRWGNFFNAEVYGVETSLPWGMTIKGGYVNAVSVHPLFLYESLWNILGFVVLHFVSVKDKKRFKGKIALMYVAWYGIGRAFLEGLRNNEYVLKMFDTIYVSQIVALFSAVIAIVLIIVFQMRKDKKPIGEYVPVYTETTTKIAEENAEKNEISEGNAKDNIEDKENIQVNNEENKNEDN